MQREEGLEQGAEYGERWECLRAPIFIFSDEKDAR